MLCLKKVNLILEEQVQLFKNPSWIYGVVISYATVTEFREMTLDIIEGHEQKAIETLVEYDHFHPVDATFALQRTLIIIWNLLSSRFELVSPIH